MDSTLLSSKTYAGCPSPGGVVMVPIAKHDQRPRKIWWNTFTTQGRAPRAALIAVAVP
jgi:hypothetical protein